MWPFYKNLKICCKLYKDHPNDNFFDNFFSTFNKELRMKITLVRKRMLFSKRLHLSLILLKKLS
jgi:hypothetical protein